MLISDSRRVLFVHVPKTGGVTVEGSVRRGCPDARTNVTPPLKRHAPLGKILAREPGLADYWSFGFVRNPWARMVSWWSMIQAWDLEHGPASGKPQEGPDSARGSSNTMWRRAVEYADFEEFVLRGTVELNRLARPQVDYLRTPQREVDFVGRTENLAADLAVVQERLGLPQRTPPRRNASTHGHYRDYYSPASRDRVAEVYAADLEAYGYDF